MKLFLTILLSVVLSVSVFAGNESDNKKANDNKSVETVEKATDVLQIAGTVLDVKNNESLAGAAIYIDGQKIYSDLDGNFVLKGVKPGVHQIRTELISYEPTVLEVDIRKDENLNIELLQK